MIYFGDSVGFILVTV